MEWWILFFVVGVSHSGRCDYRVCDGEGCTHSAVERTFGLRTSTHLHACAHARMAQGCLIRCLHLCMSSISVSPSPLSCSPAVLAVPWRSFRDHFPVRTVLAELYPTQKRQAHFRTSAEEFGYLAKSGLHTGYEPKQLDKTTPADGTTPSNDPDRDSISDFSKTTRENTGLFGVPTVFGTSVSHVSHGDFALQRESWARMPRETVARQREKQRREKVRWSVLQSRCQRKVDGTALGVMLFRLTESCSDEQDLREHLERRAQQAFIGENFSSEKITRDRVQHGDPKEEIQKTHSSSHCVSLNLKDDKYRKLINGQIKLSVREYMCAATWRWRTIFIKKALQEVAEKLKNWKDPVFKRKRLKKQRRLEETTQHDQESRTVSLLRGQVRRLQERSKHIEDSKIWYDLDSPSSYDSTHVPHQALITSSSRKPEREVGMQRNTRENMSIPGHVFLIVNMLDEILMNYTMIQEIWRHHRRFREEKELRKVRAKIHCKQYLYLAFRYRQRKKSRRQELSYVYDWPCRVFGLVLKVAWHFQVISFSEVHLKKSLTKRNFKAGSWISEQKFAQRRRISRSHCSGSRKSKQPARCRTSSIQNRFLRGSQIAYLINEIAERGPVTKGKGQNSFTERKTGECFQRKTIGSCSRRELVVFCTRMPRETVIQRGKKWETQEDLAKSKHPLQYRKWREKLNQSGGQWCDWS